MGGSDDAHIQCISHSYFAALPLRRAVTPSVHSKVAVTPLTKMIFVCVAHQRGPTGQVELFAQPAHVHFRCAFGDTE